MHSPLPKQRWERQLPSTCQGVCHPLPQKPKSVSNKLSQS